MQNPRHILITGASSGIGAALAGIYAAPGIRLSLHGRNGARLEHVAEEARRRGATVAIKTGDVVYAEGLAAWIQECDRQQPIDLVIANAGISAGTGGQGESETQARAIFAVNLAGVLNTIQPAIFLMKQRSRGQIAIISSLAGFYGFPGAPAYSASKAAVRVYGEALRGELAGQGIEVNVVCPGFIKTPMTDVNKFPMPLVMAAGRAARIIRDGLARNRACIAFPLRIYMLVQLLAMLPRQWTQRWVNALPKKPSR
ncbi:MAG: SDR family NAD(P)-dependent oxidoreductase [Bdellovibrionales bacterium]